VELHPQPDTHQLINSRPLSTPKGAAKVELHFGSMLGEALREFLSLASIASRVVETLDATAAGGVVTAYVTSEKEVWPDK